MKKILFIITILLMAESVWSDTWTERKSNVTLIDSLETSQIVTGFSRQGIRAFLFSDKSGGIFYQHRTTATAMCFNYAADVTSASTWTQSTAILGASVSNIQSTGYCYGDSVFFISATAGSNNPRIKKYIKTTASTLDTVAAISSTHTTSQFGLVKLSNEKIFAFNRSEDGSPDYLRFVLSDGGFANDITWTEKYTTATSTGYGIKLGFTSSGTAEKAGLFLYDDYYNTAYWADTSVYDTLRASFVTAAGNKAYTNYCIRTLRDSIGMMVYQNDTIHGADFLVARRFDVHGTGSGGGSILYLDSVVLEPHTSIANMWHTEPAISIIKNGANLTDSAIVFYLYWADTTNQDSADIAYKIWNGSSWGDRGIARAATATPQKMYELHAPEFSYVVSGELITMVAFTDSLANDTQKVIVEVGSITLSSSPPANITHNLYSPSQTSTSITMEDLYSGGVGVDTVWLFWDDDATIAGADSTYDATDLGSPDTVTATGLTTSTEYSFWFVISEDNGRDTSSVYTETPMPYTNVFSFIDSTGSSIKVENNYTGDIDSIVYWYGLTNYFSGAVRFTVSTDAAPDTINFTGLGSSTNYWIFGRHWSATLLHSDSVQYKTTAGTATGTANKMPGYIKEENEKWVE